MVELEGLPEGSVMDRMNAIADALIQPVNIKYVEKKRFDDAPRIA